MLALALTARDPAIVAGVEPRAACRSARMPASSSTLQRDEGAPQAVVRRMEALASRAVTA